MGRVLSSLLLPFLLLIEYGYSQQQVLYQQEDLSNLGQYASNPAYANRRAYADGQAYAVGEAYAGGEANPGGQAYAGARSAFQAGEKMTSYTCYTCSSCPQISEYTNSKHCPVSHQQPYKNNKCVAYSVYYNIPQINETTWVTRGCVTERGSCDEIRALSSKLRVVEWCEECEGDLCNSKSGGEGLAATALVAMLAPIALVKVMG